MNNTLLTRRQFGAAALGAIALGTTPSQGQSVEKLRIAAVGVGGRGAGNLAGVSSEYIAALCDVDQNNLGAAAKKFPDAKTYTDFRKLFDKPNDFDAVVVSTTEHTHYHAVMLALAAGKHVYCEKPLSHNVWEARQIRLAAAKKKVVTQMGIQIHATENYRRVVEIIQSGAIGPVTDAHVWVDRAWGLQSEEESKANKDIVYVTDRPKDKVEVPNFLDWDAWVGPAPMRPYHSVYFPGPKWYRWWDFGNGTMSDLGSHMNDLPFWALDLKAPRTIEAFGPKAHPEIAPATMRAVYEYDARGDKPAVKLHWYQGKVKPKIWEEKGIPQWATGILFVGKKGMLLCDYGKYLLLPEKDFMGYKPPMPTLPRVSSHHAEWLEAIKNGKNASANFDYAGWLTEANHLGNVAFRVGKKITWDADKLEADVKEAAPLIKRVYREGWKEVEV